MIAQEGYFILHDGLKVCGLISAGLGLLQPENKGTGVLCNIGKYLRHTETFQATCNVVTDSATDAGGSGISSCSEHR